MWLIFETPFLKKEWGFIFWDTVIIKTTFSDILIVR